MAMKGLSLGLKSGRTNNKYGYNRVGASSLSRKGQWWDLVAALTKRSGGMCESRLVDGRRCVGKAVDPHHIKPLSQGGANHLSNMIHLCAVCHARRHAHLAEMNYAQNRKEILTKARKRK